MKNFKRKISKLGYSRVICLPKEWIGDSKEVTLRQDTKNRVVINFLGTEKCLQKN